MKFFLKTFGCRVNQVESQAILEEFTSRGWVLSVMEEAELCLLNTCTVTHQADKDVEKLIRQGYPVSAQSAREHLYDLGGIRVVCSFVEDVYELYDKLARQPDLEIIEVKDYIKYPKDNGYRSLHLLVEVPVFLTNKTERVVIEVQIRTIAMDFWASLEHKLYYKQGKVVPRQVLIGLNQCADLAALLDEKMQDIRNKMKPYLSEEERAVQAAKAEDEKCMNCLE